MLANTEKLSQISPKTRQHIFACNSGEFISILYKCDDFQTCKERHFTCNNKQCLDRKDQCDMNMDCLDGSDETSCYKITIHIPDLPVKRCKNRFVKKSQICDFKPDCIDMSDENLDYCQNYNEKWAKSHCHSLYSSENVSLMTSQYYREFEKYLFEIRTDTGNI
ncbi:DgyrCDS14559 [Dimorphilus gyrociliatus]|uniref:DgyrCDS14559 n=1 Tax=Dimorphilus gyrociliatus TaxID=2664684 RepID=A0A7I8WE62_9ANNE|nr:DgyrCDS14559 [Dimorphilus gyrociliatus]